MQESMHQASSCSIFGSCQSLLHFLHFPKPTLYALTPILPHFSWTMQCYLMHPPIFICSPFSFRPPNLDPHSTPEFHGEHYPPFNTLSCSVIRHSWVFFDYLLPELSQYISHSILCISGIYFHYCAYLGICNNLFNARVLN